MKRMRLFQEFGNQQIYSVSASDFSVGNNLSSMKPNEERRRPYHFSILLQPHRYCPSPRPPHTPRHVSKNLVSYLLKNSL